MIDDLLDASGGEAGPDPVVEIDATDAGGVEDALARDDLQQHHAEREHITGQR